MDIMKPYDTAAQSIETVGRHLHAFNCLEQLDQVKELNRQLHAMRHDSENWFRALAAARGKYQPGPEPYDFARDIQECLDATARQYPYDAERDELAKKVEAAMQPGNRAGGDDDDDVAIDASADDALGLRNPKCPLSAKMVEALDEPVEDKEGYVYERVDVENYLRTTGGGTNFAPCPIFGCQHQICLSELRPSQKALYVKARAQRRRQMGLDGHRGGAAR